MNPEQIITELCDRYAKGQLSVDDRAAFEERMRSDSSFRQKAEEHAELIAALKHYGDRNQLRQLLDEIHSSIDSSEKNVPKKVLAFRFWPMAAVAASVALICIVGTLLMTQKMESKQTAYYKELRRNVDQIKKSQKLIMDDLAEAKEKTFPGNYAGTGFLLSAKGYVATSYHVVKEADSVVIENDTYGRLKTVVVHSDPINDISILKIDKPLGLKSLPFTIVEDEASLAEEVYTLGYPREDVVFGEGSVSALTGYLQNPNAYQISIPVNPGNSGGPLLNSKGDLIGMISGLQTQTSGAAFAIKSSVLLNSVVDPAMDSLLVPLALPKQNTIKSVGRIQQVKQWRDFVFVVRVYKN